MMKKINYQDPSVFDNGHVRSLVLDRPCANESRLADESVMKLLPGGSIDYAYYDKKARSIRSNAAHRFLSHLSNIFKVLQKK